MPDPKPKTPDARDLWAELAAPFELDELELLPRAIGDKNARHKEKCAECGGYHDFPCIHLTYVGHAGITKRLNSVDPTWEWEPMGHTPEGLPAFDTYGGLWGRMTVLGVTKPCYGDPGLSWDGKPKRSPDGQKEAIGDLIRNGAMRFGVGTYLWSKSDRAKAELTRQGEDDGEPSPSTRDNAPQARQPSTSQPSTPTSGNPSATTPAVLKLIDELVAHGVEKRTLTDWIAEHYGTSLVKDIPAERKAVLAEALRKRIADARPAPEGDAVADALGAEPVGEAAEAAAVAEELADPNAPEIGF